MDLKQLRALVTVAETGNVTKASALLNIVQPAVSRQLRLLEEDMGTALFDRGRHGMELTESGKTMVEYARRILNEVARAKAEISAAFSGSMTKSMKSFAFSMFLASLRTARLSVHTG